MELKVKYTNPDTHEEYSQTFDLDESSIEKVYDQLLTYSGGEIPINSPLYYLFTSVNYLSKLQGFTKTPNFELDPPNEILVRKMNIN